MLVLSLRDRQMTVVVVVRFCFMFSSGFLPVFRLFLSVDSVKLTTAGTASQDPI